VSGPNLKSHRYDLQAVESLDTPLGLLQTFHIRRGDPDGEKQTDMWLAEEIRFLPVKMVYRKEDGVNTMNLVDISFND
jgi:hypothetical protein